MKDLHFTDATSYLKAPKTTMSSPALLGLARQALYNGAEFSKHDPEEVPNWLQGEKIRKAQEKRGRKAKARGVR